MNYLFIITVLIWTVHCAEIKIDRKPPPTDERLLNMRIPSDKEYLDSLCKSPPLHVIVEKHFREEQRLLQQTENEKIPETSSSNCIIS